MDRKENMRVNIYELIIKTRQNIYIFNDKNKLREIKREKDKNFIDLLNKICNTKKIKI
jgi:hypothetical protein